MKIFETIINLIKKVGKFVIDLFKDNKIAEVANNTTTTIAGIATSAVAVAAGVNIVKNLIEETKSDVKASTSEKRSKTSGDEYARDRILSGSADDKIRNLKASNRAMFSKSYLSDEDLALLEKVAKERNSFFKVLTPEEQMKLLKMENFDFEAAKRKYEEEDKSFLFGLIHRKGRRIGAPTEDAPFRKPVDYGWLNFIARPLDDFLCWWKNDPTPKPCEQVRLVDPSEIPDIPFDSINEVIGAVSSFMDFNINLANEVSPEDIAVDEIFAQELFKTKKLKSTKRAVNKRMINSQEGLSKTIFSLMDDEIKIEKKSKKKKKKDKDKDGSKLYYSKDKGGKKKKNKELDDKADKYAEGLFNYHINLAIQGKQAHTGYKMK